MTDLHPYQRAGAAFLAERRRAYLADRMGLGKTAQAVRAAAAVEPWRTLVVCPASAVPHWEHEWRKWEGPGEPLIVSYERQVRSPARASLVILDEAHYCKTPSAKRTKAALKAARLANRAWLLSGTPMPNFPTELWAPIKALWPEVAKKHKCTTAVQWRDRFCACRMTPWGLKPYAVRNGAALRASLDSFMLRRSLSDVNIELPPMRVDVERIPGDLLKGALDEYDEVDAADEGYYVSKLRRLLGTAKAPVVAARIAEEIRAGAYKKIVVLYYHNDVRDVMRTMLDAYKVSHTGFGGADLPAARQRAIEAFQTPTGDTQVFLAQQTAAGVAINLTAASEIVLIEPAWSPEDNAQAIARIHRIGQEHPCRARIFAASGTLDEAIMGTLANKVRMSKAIGLGG